MMPLFSAFLALIHLVPPSHLEAQNEQLAAPLPDSATGVQPVLVGTMLPSVELRTTAGDTVDLDEARVGKPSVIIIYRGGW